MNEQEWRAFLLGMCTGASGVLIFSVIFWELGVGG